MKVKNHTMASTIINTHGAFTRNSSQLKYSLVGLIILKSLGLASAVRVTRVVFSLWGKIFGCHIGYVGRMSGAVFGY
jgi:hypothetical protein